MLSSKCCQVESPSPFRFFAALMPPCAHTEWDRLTGTMEKRSTCPPISAILMAAERPASPPPTTMILGCDMMIFTQIYEYGRSRRSLNPRSWYFLVVLDPGDLSGRRSYKARYCPKSNADEHKCQSSANVAELASRVIAGRQTPLGRKQPNTVSEMPRRGNDSDDVEGYRPRTLEVEPHFRECVLIATAHQMYTREPHIDDVVRDIDEGDNAGPALRGIKPIAGPGIVADIRIAFVPDVQAVDPVIQQRQEDEHPFQHVHEWQAGEELYLIVVGLNALGRFRVGNEVFNQESADGHNAGERMQAA